MQFDEASGAKSRTLGSRIGMEFEPVPARKFARTLPSPVRLTW